MKTITKLANIFAYHGGYSIYLVGDECMEKLK